MLLLQMRVEVLPHFIEVYTIKPTHKTDIPFVFFPIVVLHSQLTEGVYYNTEDHIKHDQVYDKEEQYLDQCQSYVVVIGRSSDLEEVADAFAPTDSVVEGELEAVVKGVAVDVFIRRLPFFVEVLHNDC